MTRYGNRNPYQRRGFVDLNFARRLEMAETATRDQVSAFERYWPDATTEVLAGATAIFGGVTYPANHIVRIVLYRPVIASDLDRIEEFYRSRGVACEIVVSPLADSSLRDLFAPRGTESPSSTRYSSDRWRVVCSSRLPTE